MSQSIKGRRRLAEAIWVAVAASLLLFGYSCQAQQATAANDTSADVPLNEIIVTAEKKYERLQDVADAVTEISSESLLEQNLVRIQDYATEIPGVAIRVGLDNNPEITIRGLNSSSGSATTAILIDDAPVGSQSIGGLPNLDPSEIASVEVLRGPQGTLYGASAIGGILKFVTLDPSTDKFSGRVEAGTETVYNGNELGYSFRGSVNVPVSDTFAFRASGFVRQDPGYVDNVLVNQQGVNQDEAKGTHIAALWQPSEDLSVKGSFLYQRDQAYGASQEDLRSGGSSLDQSRIGGTGSYDHRSSASNILVRAKIAPDINLTSVTTYIYTAASDNPDYSVVLTGLPQFYFNVPGAPIPGSSADKVFTEELRLNGKIGKVDWLVGSYYSRDSATFFYNYLASTLTGVPVGSFGTAVSPAPGVQSELAGFVNFNVHFTDRLSVQLGGRESRVTSSYYEIDESPPPDPPVFVPTVVDTSHSRADAFTYLASPQYKFSEELMVYFRAASGFRAGGSNTNCGLAAGVPCEYSPDKTLDYELGAKSSWFDKKLTVNTAVFYIDWTNLQVPSLTLGQTFPAGYTGNAGGAKSEGVEVEAQWEPVQTTTINGWLDYTDAALTKSFVTSDPSKCSGNCTYGVAGNQLPYGSRWSGNLSGEQHVPLPVITDATGFIGGTVRYVGERFGQFIQSPERQIFPAYTEIDLRAGVRWNQWVTNVFATNVADRRGQQVFSNYNALSQNVRDQTTVAYIQPRTVGVSVSHTF